ncbi:MAG: hypothetical protein GYA24_01275 [Candidatus Lokiarchaeota archaeon]|nr:hypothetical protein [Candidatus Lokiarchaeota archaeon]
MTKVQVIGIPNSKKVKELVAFLKKNKINHAIWSIDDSDIKRKLLDDSKFTEKYCDLAGCMSKLPMLRIDETGEYVVDGLFKNDALQDEVARKVIGLK